MKAVVAFLLCLLPCGVMAQAQAGIYGKFDYTRYTDHYANSELSLSGADAGGYYDFVHAGPMQAGIDLRGSLLSAGQYRYRSALFGVRAGVKTPVLPLRPYAQFSVGIGGTQFTGPLAAGIATDSYSNKFLYEVLGGVDYTVLPHVDFRVIELGYGRVSGVNGSSTDNPASTLFTIGTGVVVRFP